MRATCVRKPARRRAKRQHREQTHRSSIRIRSRRVTQNRSGGVSPNLRAPAPPTAPRRRPPPRWPSGAPASRTGRRRTCADTRNRIRGRTRSDKGNADMRSGRTKPAREGGEGRSQGPLACYLRPISLKNKDNRIRVLAVSRIRVSACPCVRLSVVSARTRREPPAPPARASRPARATRAARRRPSRRRSGPRPAAADTRTDGTADTDADTVVRGVVWRGEVERKRQGGGF